MVKIMGWGVEDEQPSAFSASLQRTVADGTNQRLGEKR